MQLVYLYGVYRVNRHFSVVHKIG